MFGWGQPKGPGAGGVRPLARSSAIPTLPQCQWGGSLLRSEWDDYMAETGKVKKLILDQAEV